MTQPQSTNDVSTTAENIRSRCHELVDELDDRGLDECFQSLSEFVEFYNGGGFMTQTEKFHVSPTV